MRTLQKEVNGIDWGDGAVMNCHWRGPRLRDVLLKAGPNFKGKAHVAFACYSTDVQEDTWYGGSIELERGLSLDGEVILALEVCLATAFTNDGANNSR
jgi:sulfite oxidase